MDRWAIGDVGKTTGALDTRGHVLEHALKVHEADSLGLLDIHGCDNTIHPYFFIGYTGLVGKIDQFDTQCCPFVFITGETVRAPHKGDEVTIMLCGNGYHALISFRSNHNGVNKGRQFADRYSSLDGIDIGCVKRQRHIINNFLDHFYYPWHQLGTVLFGGAQVDIDIIHPFFFLKKGFLLNRFGIALLVCPTDLLGNNV